jgi:hypothetical protein
MMKCCLQITLAQRGMLHPANVTIFGNPAATPRRQPARTRSSLRALNEAATAVARSRTAALGEKSGTPPRVDCWPAVYLHSVSCIKARRLPLLRDLQLRGLRAVSSARNCRRLPGYLSAVDPGSRNRYRPRAAENPRKFRSATQACC